MSVKVAIVEDEAAISHMYAAKLQQEGFDVQTAANGAEGMELVRKFHPEVVLLDVMMPDTTGVDFMAELRRKRDNDKIKVLVMTNLDDALMRDSMDKFQVNGYLVKAEVTPAEVVDKINSLIAKK